MPARSTLELRARARAGSRPSAPSERAHPSALDRRVADRRPAPRSPSSISSESLWPVGVEELDAVVLVRVVRRRDHDARGRARAAARAPRRPASAAPRRAAPDHRRQRCRRRAPTRASRPRRACRARPGPAGSPAGQTPAAARPSANASSGVRNSPTAPRTPSVPNSFCFGSPRPSRGGLALGELGRLRAFLSPALRRSLTRGSRVRSCRRLSSPRRLRVRLDQRLRDAVPDRVRLARDAAAVNPGADVERSR